MSLLSDIQYTLSSDTIKSKLTIEERAQILVELAEDLYIDRYWDVKKCNYELKFAIKDLKVIDDKSK